MFIYTRLMDHIYNYEPAMQPREQDRPGLDRTTVRGGLIELMFEENRAGVLVRDQC